MAILNISVPVRIRECVAKMMSGVFSVSALNQIHRVIVSSSENPVQTSDLASRVKLWRVIVLYKFQKRGILTVKEFRRELTGQLLSEKVSAKTNRGSLKEFIMNSNDLKQKSGCQFGGE